MQQVKRSIWNQHILVNVDVTNIDKSSYPEETELHTNHGLNPGQPQTLSTDERSFCPFLYKKFNIFSLIFLFTNVDYFQSVQG